MKETITVYLEEEYGYREWIWFTGMSAADLEAYWTGLASVNPFAMTPVGLPGELVQIVEDLTEIEALCEKIKADTTLSDEERDLKIAEVYENTPCRMIRFDTGEAAPEKQSTWWRGHIHMDDDSLLTTASGRVITHAGFIRSPDPNTHWHWDPDWDLYESQ